MYIQRQKQLPSIAVKACDIETKVNAVYLDTRCLRFDHFKASPTVKEIIEKSKTKLTTIQKARIRAVVGIHRHAIDKDPVQRCLTN